MKNVLTAGAALLLTTSIASAGGLDRSGQPVGLIFEEGNALQLSFGYVMPEVTGEITNPFFGPLVGSQSGDVAGDYGVLGGGLKAQTTDQLSVALIFDQPYGAAVAYSDSDPTYPAAGTEANVRSTGVTGLARYELNENFSVHGGVRLVYVEGDYLAVQNGATVYQSDYSRDTGMGYVLGAAYEREDIALRVALTYSSAIDFELDGSNGDLTTTMPESINLDFQTGIAADTLLFGSVRYAAWDGVALIDSTYSPLAGPLVEYSNDVYTYNVGIGRRLNSKMAASFSVGYEAATDEPATNLSPTDGYVSLALGGSYQVSDELEVAGGIRYIMPGDTVTDLTELVPDTDTTFADNSAIAIGVSMTYSF